jgi:hypothetical protein
LRLLYRNTEEFELHGHAPAADAKLNAPAAELIEHADLLEGAQRMIQVQQHDHWPKPELARTLRGGSQEQTGRCRQAMRRAVMLRQVIGMQARSVAGFYQLQPFRVLLTCLYTRIV